MRRQSEKLTQDNVKILVITFESGDVARKYIEETGIMWPLLIDETREVYHNYGMLSASFWDIWGPKTWWAYFKEIMKGHTPHMSTGDVTQRGGDVLVDQQGIIRLHHIGDGPADRPSINMILKVLGS